MNYSLLKISHRGNLFGVDPDKENHPEQIDLVLRRGFDCEIDVRCHEGNLYLGHDEPTHLIDANWLQRRYDHLWVHAKDREALFTLQQISGLNYFWHQEDEYTMTSKGWIWCYPGYPGLSGIKTIGLFFDPPSDDSQFVGFDGVCSNHVALLP